MYITKEEFETALVNARDAGIQAVIGMTDSFPCGGAYHTAPGDSMIVKAFKKYGLCTGDKEYEAMGWRCYRNRGGNGYVLSHGGAGYQNMDMHSVRATKESGVLGMSELPTSVHTYID